MKKTLREIKQSHRKNIERIKSLNNLQEKRDLTDSENTQLEDLFSVTSDLKQEIEKREKVRDLELSIENAKDSQDRLILKTKVKGRSFLKVKTFFGVERL